MAKVVIDECDDKSIPLDPNPQSNTTTQQDQQSETQDDKIKSQPLNESCEGNSNNISSYKNNLSEHSISNLSAVSVAEEQQRKAEMMADEDPLLISQSLTYVTDDGGILHSFQSSPFSFGTSTNSMKPVSYRFRTTMCFSYDSLSLFLLKSLRLP